MMLALLIGCGGSGEPIGWTGPCCDSTPIVHGRVLAGWGWITDAQTGVGLVLFDSDPGGPVVGAMSTGAIQGAPALGGDEMLLFANDALVAYTAAGPYWEVPLPGVASTPVSIGADERLVVGTDTGALLAFDRDGNALGAAGLTAVPVGRAALEEDGSAVGFARDGADDWWLYRVGPDVELEILAPMPVPLTQAALFGDGSVVATVSRGDPSDPDPDVDLVAFDAATGEERWSFDVGAPTSTAVELENGDAVVSTADALLGVRDGQEVWRADGAELGEPTVGDDGRIYLGCAEGLCAYREAGLAEVFALPRPGGPTLPPALHGGNAIVNHERYYAAVPLGRDVRPASTWARAGADNRGTGGRRPR